MKIAALKRGTPFTPPPKGVFKLSCGINLFRDGII